MQHWWRGGDWFFHFADEKTSAWRRERIVHCLSAAINNKRHSTFYYVKYQVFGNKRMITSHLMVGNGGSQISIRSGLEKTN